MNTTKLTRYGSAAGLMLVLASCQANISPVTQTIPMVSAQPTLVAASSVAAIPSQVATPAPTGAPVPSASPLATSIPVQAELRYLWPTTLPQGMQIQTVAAIASTEMFVLNVDAPGTQWSAMITGGPSSRAVPPPVTGTQAVTVRNQPGISFSTGAGYSLFWQEGLHQYAILSTLSLDDALALANGLQSLDQPVWQANLAQVASTTGNTSDPASPSTPPTPPSAPEQAKLQYLWPSNLPLQMQIDAIEATASADIFVINVSAPGTQWSATITGGPTSRAIQAPPATSKVVEVRGQPGAAFSTGGGYSLFWNEGRHSYAVLGTLSLDDALALADGLQPLDQETWQANLQEVLQAHQ